MLDTFLTVAYQKTKKAEAQDRQVELLKKLPNDLLFKIASGQEKLGYGAMASLGGGCEDWIEKFQGTPLLQEAVALRKEELELEMAEAQHRQQEDQHYQAVSAERQQNTVARDELCIKKKMLELQLVESAGAESSPAPVQESPAPAPAEPAPTKVAAAAGKAEALARRGAELLTGSKAKKLVSAADKLEGRAGGQHAARFPNSYALGHIPPLKQGKHLADQYYGVSGTGFKIHGDSDTRAIRPMPGGPASKASHKARAMAEAEQSRVNKARAGAGGAALAAGLGTALARRKEASAGALVYPAVLAGSGYMGHQAGKQIAEDESVSGADRPEWGVGKYLASALIHPYGAYQIGKSIGYGHGREAKKEHGRESKKEASASDFQFAVAKMKLAAAGSDFDSMTELEKQAFLGSLIGAGAKAVGSGVQALGGLASRAAGGLGSAGAKMVGAGERMAAGAGTGTSRLLAAEKAMPMANPAAGAASPLNTLARNPVRSTRNPLADTVHLPASPVRPPTPTRVPTELAPRTAPAAAPGGTVRVAPPPTQVNAPQQQSFLGGLQGAGRNVASAYRGAGGGMAGVRSAGSMARDVTTDLARAHPMKALGTAGALGVGGASMLGGGGSQNAA
jgi:DNA-binding protein H-NS